MNYFAHRTISTEHLLNIRKIVDDMAMQAALLRGEAEALRLLFPDFMTAQSRMDIYNAACLTTGNVPLAIQLAEISKEIGIELENRKKGLSQEPKGE